MMIGGYVMELVWVILTFLAVGSVRGAAQSGEGNQSSRSLSKLNRVLAHFLPSTTGIQPMSVVNLYASNTDPIDFFAQYPFTNQQLHLFPTALEQALKGEITSLPRCSPTRKHLTMNAADIKRQCKNVSDSALFNALVSKAIYVQYQSEWDNWPITKNKVCHVKDSSTNPPYTTFVHGQSSNYFLLQHIYTVLWSIKNNVPLRPDFTFLQIRPEDDRLRLIGDKENQRGILQFGLTLDRHEREVVFMNYPVTGNVKRDGESTLYYVKMSQNIDPKTISYDDMFALFNTPETAKKYSDQLKKLGELYQQITKYGTFVLISIPTDLVKSTVSLVSEGGGLEEPDLIGFENKNEEFQYTSTRSVNFVTREFRNQAISSKAWLMDLDKPIFIAHIGKIALDPTSRVRIYKITEHKKDSPAFIDFLKQYRTLMSSLTKDFIAELSKHSEQKAGAVADKPSVFKTKRYSPSIVHFMIQYLESDPSPESKQVIAQLNQLKRQSHFHPFAVLNTPGLLDIFIRDARNICTNPKMANLYQLLNYPIVQKGMENNSRYKILQEAFINHDYLQESILNYFKLFFDSGTTESDVQNFIKQSDQWGLVDVLRNLTSRLRPFLNMFHVHGFQMIEDKLFTLRTKSFDKDIIIKTLLADDDIGKKHFFQGYIRYWVEGILDVLFDYVKSIKTVPEHIRNYLMKNLSEQDLLNCFKVIDDTFYQECINYIPKKCDQELGAKFLRFIATDNKVDAEINKVVFEKKSLMATELLAKKELADLWIKYITYSDSYSTHKLYHFIQSDYAQERLKNNPTVNLVLKSMYEQEKESFIKKLSQKSFLSLFFGDEQGKKTLETMPYSFFYTDYVAEQLSFPSVIDLVRHHMKIMNKNDIATASNSIDQYTIPMPDQLLFTPQELIDSVPFDTSLKNMAERWLELVFKILAINIMRNKKESFDNDLVNGMINVIFMKEFSDQAMKAYLRALSPDMVSEVWFKVWGGHLPLINVLRLYIPFNQIQELSPLFFRWYNERSHLKDQLADPEIVRLLDSERVISSDVDISSVLRLNNVNKTARELETLLENIKQDKRNQADYGYSMFETLDDLDPVIKTLSDIEAKKRYVVNYYIAPLFKITQKDDPSLLALDEETVINLLILRITISLIAVQQTETQPKQVPLIKSRL